MAKIPTYQRHIFASENVGQPNVNVSALSAPTAAAARGAEAIGGILRQSGAMARQETGALADQTVNTAGALSQVALTATRIAVAAADQQKKKVVDKAATTRFGMEYASSLEGVLSDLTDQSRANPNENPPSMIAQKFQAKADESMKNAMKQFKDPAVAQAFGYEGAKTLRSYMDKARKVADGVQLDATKENFKVAKQLGVSRGAAAGSIDDLLSAMQSVDHDLVNGFAPALGGQADEGSRATRAAMLNGYIKTTIARNQPATVLEEFDALARGVIHAEPDSILYGLYDGAQLVDMKTELVTQLQTFQKKKDYIDLAGFSQLLQDFHVNMGDGVNSPMKAQQAIDGLNEQIDSYKNNPYRLKDDAVIATMETQRDNLKKAKDIILKGGGLTVDQEKKDMAGTVADAMAGLFSTFDKKTGTYKGMRAFETNTIEDLQHATEVQKIIMDAEGVGAISAKTAHDYLNTINNAMKVVGRKIQPETVFKGGIDPDNTEHFTNYKTMWDYGLQAVMNEASRISDRGNRAEMKAEVIPAFFRLFEKRKADLESMEPPQAMTADVVQTIARSVMQSHYTKTTGERPPAVGEYSLVPGTGFVAKVTAINPATGRATAWDTTPYQEQLIKRMKQGR